MNGNAGLLIRKYEKCTQNQGLLRGFQISKRFKEIHKKNMWITRNAWLD
jgi:hypothetical protein